MSVESANILLDNLGSLLAHPLHEEFVDVFRRARALTTDEEMILPNFQDQLQASVSARAEEADEALLERVVRRSRCPWIRDLLLHAAEESASVLGRAAPPSPEDVSMPAFLRACVTMVGRQLYRNPIVLYDRFKRAERERNRSLFDAMVRTAVGECVSALTVERPPTAGEPHDEPPTDDDSDAESVLSL